MATLWSAEDGCEIHIREQPYHREGRDGVLARAANVHIDNSQIEGDSASIDASDGAQVYASSSRFSKGMSRRLDNSLRSMILGGNASGINDTGSLLRPGLGFPRQ